MTGLSDEEVMGTGKGLTDQQVTGAAQPAPVPANTPNAEAYQAVADKLYQRTVPGALATAVSQSTGEPAPLSDEAKQHLQAAGMSEEFSKNQDQSAKAFDDAVLKPAAQQTYEGSILPFSTDAQGNTHFDINAGLTGALLKFVTAPGRALEGNMKDPEGEARDFAQWIAFGGFSTSLKMNAGFSTEGIPLAAKETPVPPSMQQSVVVAPKPWQAEIPTAEAAPAAEGSKALAITPRSDSPPPINNLPVPGSPEAKAAEAGSVPAHAADPIQHTSPVIDGSGNLNLDFIRADQDTKDIMAKVSQAYADKYGTEVPHIETQESAQAFMDEAMGQVTNGIPDALGNFSRGDAVSRDALWTARQLGVQLATDFGRLAKTATATGAPEDQLAAQQAFERMVQVVGPIRHEMTAEAGRILESMKIPVGEGVLTATGEQTAITEQAALKLAGMNSQDALRIAGTLDTPQSVAKFVQDLQKPSFADMGLYYVFNNYLSGPITHLAYAASWAIQTVIRAGLETPIASAIGKAQELAGKTLDPAEVSSLYNERMTLASQLANGGKKLTAVARAPIEARLQEIADRLKNGTTVMPAESAARFYGIGEGALDSIRAFGRALKTADVQMLPGEMQKAMTAAQEAEASALKKGLSPQEARAAGQKAYQDAATNFGNPIVEYGKMIKNPTGSFAVQAAGQVIGVPMRVIAAIHSLQKFSGYAESMNAFAYRQAATEGLTDNALAARIASIKNNPTPEMMQRAADEAKYAALMGQSGKVGKAFQDLANSNAWTRMIVPFSKVVTNLTSQKILERTPVGLLSPVIRGRIMGEEGNAAQATQLAKMLTGSTLLTGGAYLAAQGINNGWGSDDKKERAFQYLSGHPPYSITIGDINLPHRFFGVAGGSLSLGADIHDISQVMSENDAGWSDWMGAMGASIHYIGRDILSENALTGPANLYNAINDRENAAKNFVPNAIASSFVPFSTFQSQMTQRFIDPIMRQTMGEDTYGTVMQTIQSRTPFMSSGLMPKVDIFGNPMQRDSDHSWAEKDPVMQALTHLQFYPSAIQPKLFGVALDEKQFADYATIAGKLFYNKLLPLASNPNWVRVPERTQAEIVQNAIKESRGKARAAMALLYPQIAKDSNQQKLDLLNQYDDTSP